MLEVENKMAEFVYERDNAIKVVETMKLKVKESEEVSLKTNNNNFSNDSINHHSIFLYLSLNLLR